MSSRLKQTARLLLELRSPAGEWDAGGRLREWPSSKKKANAWFLCCLLDYAIKADRAWDNGIRLAQEVLGDPDDLWRQITATSMRDWVSLCREHRIHRFPVAYERIWRIAHEVAKHYDSDARNIWKSVGTDCALERLIELGVGQQLSRMVVGGLRDSKQVKGAADVKADIHVRRVLGRAIDGDICSPDRALELARRMSPQDPWLLDGPTWSIGYEHCAAAGPHCEECPLNEVCAFVNGDDSPEEEFQTKTPVGGNTMSTSSRRGSGSSGPRRLLPKMHVKLHCEECGADVTELDINVQQLASKLTESRRKHAREAHGYTE